MDRELSDDQVLAIGNWQLGIGQLHSWNDLPGGRVWRVGLARVYAWKMPSRSAVAAVVRLVRVCVQVKRKHNNDGSSGNRQGSGTNKVR